MKNVSILKVSTLFLITTNTKAKLNAGVILTMLKNMIGKTNDKVTTLRHIKLKKLIKPYLRFISSKPHLVLYLIKKKRALWFNLVQRNVQKRN